MIDYLRVRFPTIDALAIIRDVLQLKADYMLLEDYGSTDMKVSMFSATSVSRVLPKQRKDGKDPMQLARILQKEKVLAIKSKYAKCIGKPVPDNPYL